MTLLCSVELDNYTRAQATRQRWQTNPTGQPSKPQGTSTTMTGSLHPIRTKEQLTAGFPTIVPAITGDVNLKEIIRLWQHIKRCAHQTETNFDAQNFLYVVLPPGLRPYFSTRQYPAAPLDPGTNPSYNGGADATANTTIRDLWQLDYKYHEEHKHINTTLVDRFLKLLPDAHNQSQTILPRGI